jgi:tripartite-type tricarboxylate transporter receptor subunit TctC
MGTELFKSMAGIDILHIPYKGTGPALNDVMAGQVQLIFGSIIATLPHVKSGKLRGIAVTGLKRADAAPEIPTVDESGLPGYSFTGWYVMLAPAKTPRPIVMLLNREVVRSLQLPELKDRLAAEGSTVVAGTPEELRAHLRREVAKWMKVVKTANIGLDAAR